MWTRPRVWSWGVVCGVAVLCGCAAPHIDLPLLPTFPPSATQSIFWEERFDQLGTDQWREVEVHGHTSYAAVTLDGRACLKAHSQAAASILLHQAQFNPRTHEWLSWDWRVEKLVPGEALDRKDGSDAAARLYVYFETTGLPWQKRNIDYVWSATLPVGTILDSAFSSASKIIVVESGADSVGQWRRVQRNLTDDYTRCFGEDPPDVIAIGVMTDADNTRGEALAYYDDLSIRKTRKE